MHGAAGRRLSLVYRQAFPPGLQFTPISMPFRCFFK